MSILPPELYQAPVIDFVEIAPETLCQERRKGSTVVVDLLAHRMDEARTTCGTLPIVVHGVELSIGSAHGWNEAYLDMLDRFQHAWPFRWHSEHLGFQTISGDDGGSVEIGVPLPLPATREAARLVASRCALLPPRYGVPFLLENPAHYLSDLPHDPQFGDEIDFMNSITATGHCGQLLDLHNLYCNAINHHFDVFAALDRVALDRVVEIHVAGGSWRNGFWMDAHDGRVPPPVWDMLEYALPRAPQVAGVVFELLDEYAPRLGVAAIVDELAHARDIWNRCHVHMRRAA